MRENIGLFKAQRINSVEWVTGLLTIMWGQYHIINPNDENTAYPIKTETLCEFTGLTDKNGKMIFENDILNAYGSYDLTVSWDDENAMFYAEYEGTKSGHEDDDNDDYAEACDFINYEIIGNKFDNPELVEVAE